jgi:hypothetical protein
MTVRKLQGKENPLTIISGKTSVSLSRESIAQRTSQALAISVGGIMATADRLLTIDEAAAVLNTSKDYLYRNWRKLPFVVQLSPRQLRFSLQGIYKYIESKQEEQHGRTGIQAG